MFTGIIEEIGHIQGLRKGGKSSVLSIGAEEIMQDIRLGDSIAVNGVCLTVTSFSQSGFTADVMHETLDRSSLGSLHIGSPVNLERALPANGRLGGHIVSGHIDGTGTISAIQKDDNAVWYTIKTNDRILRYVIEKGSIAIDGISLTVAKVQKDSFSVSVIPHTAKNTILPQKRIGDTVNLENDCIGKYVERLMGFDKSKSNITNEFLTKYGF
ncbi:MAG: riboflavin synthase [Clostridiales bacterium]|jgi:riboflavin synthase|nr:riboflavin synthase [Clostridiales bacterium]